jgi:hypothetical protein
VLLLYFAATAFRGWQRGARPAEALGSAPRTLLQAAAVNVANPNPYLAWALVLGPALLRAWRVGAAVALAFVAAFYGTMVLTLAATIFLFGATRWLSPRGRQLLVLASALVLAVLGLYQLGVGLLGRAA